MAKKETSASGELGVGDFIAPAANILGTFTSDDATFGAKGGAIGGGIGAGIGAAFGGPVGAQIGNMLGSTVGQLIGGAKDKRLAKERMSSTMTRKYGQLNLAYNAEPYGSGSTFYAEDGLVLPGAGDMVPVNIEKGELMVDPATMKVLQKFDTKRYKRHAKDKNQEHPGNFIEMDASHVIIPKDKAKAFAGGDRISRRSIIAQIMEDQEKNGIEINEGVQYAKKGKGPGDGYAWVGKLGKDKVTAQQNYLISKGADIKADGMYGPKTAAAMKQYGLMPELGVSLEKPGSPKPLAVDMAAITNFGLPKMDDGSQVPFAPLKDVNTGIVSGVADKNPVVSVNTDKALEGARNPTEGLIINPEVSSRKPNLLEKIGLANLGGDMNSVKAARVANTLPTIFGMVQAGQSDPFLQYDENAQMDGAKAYVSQMPVDENIEASRAAIAQGQAGYLKAMRNVNSPAARAEVADFMLKSQTQAGQIEQDAQGRKLGRVAQKLGMLADIEQKQGEGRLQARNKFALESSQDRAVRQNMLHSAISEGATNFAKSVMDDEKVKAVNAALKYNKIKPGSATGIEEDTDAVNNAIMLISSILPNSMINPAVVPKTTVIDQQKKNAIGAPAGSTKTVIQKK